MKSLMKICIVVMFFYKVAGAYAENLLSNPSLELWHDTLGVLVPEGWVISPVYSTGIVTKSENAYKGKFAAQLSIPPDTGYVGGVYKEVEIRGGTSYTYKFYYNCPAEVKGYAVIIQYNSSDSILETDIGWLSKTLGYSLFDTTFITHADAVKCGILCSISAEGDSTWKMCCDNFELFAH